MMYRRMHGQAPRYLSVTDHITPASEVASRLRLSSISHLRQLVVPRWRTYSIAVLTVWNLLSQF